MSDENTIDLHEGPPRDYREEAHRISRSERSVYGFPIIPCEEHIKALMGEIFDLCADYRDVNNRRKELEAELRQLTQENIHLARHCGHLVQENHSLHQRIQVLEAALADDQQNKLEVELLHGRKS